MVLNWTQLPHLVFNLQLAAEPVGCFRNELATLVVELNACMNQGKRERKIIWLLWRPTTKFLALTWIKLLKMFHLIPKKINSVIWTSSLEFLSLLKRGIALQNPLEGKMVYTLKIYRFSRNDIYKTCLHFQHSALPCPSFEPAQLQQHCHFLCEP